MNWSRLLVSCGVLAALSASPESEAQSARETVDGASVGYVAVRVSDGGQQHSNTWEPIIGGAPV